MVELDIFFFKGECRKEIQLSRVKALKFEADSSISIWNIENSKNISSIYYSLSCHKKNLCVFKKEIAFILIKLRDHW